MIDYCKFLFFIKNQDLLNNPYLDFQFEVNEKTGEISNKKIAEFGYLRFVYYDTEEAKIIISGSLHKYYNFIRTDTSFAHYTKGFNGNDFTYINLLNTLNDISERFNIDLNKLFIKNIEAGFNVSVPFEVNNVLDGLLMHKGKVFNRPLSCTYRQTHHSQFLIKIYDKSLQYCLDGNILRVECKWIKMESLKPFNIIKANDLFDKSKLYYLKEILIAKWHEVLLFDFSIKEAFLSNKQMIKLKDFSNPIYWIRLKPYHRNRPKKELQFMVDKYSDNIQMLVAELLELKWIDTIVNCVINDHSSIGSNITQKLLTKVV